MSSTEKYNIWFTITIAHEYYGDGNCPVRLQPSLQTDALLKRHQILYREITPNRWVFLTLSPEIESEIAGEELHLALTPVQDSLYYVTDIPGDHSGTDDYKITRSTEPGRWMQITLSLRLGMPDIPLTLPAKSKYFEYNIINRQQKEDIQLKIEEKQQRIRFAKSETLENSPLGKGVCIRSTDKISLKKSYAGYSLQLIEVKTNGEKVLCSNLPFPNPRNTSLARPYDTITTYYYI